MSIELTEEQLKRLMEPNHTQNEPRPCGESCPWVVGEKYLVRCVTNYFTGRLIAVHEKELVFEDAAWIADTGRFSTALKQATFEEVEPYPGQVIIGRGSVCDASVWCHELPREAK